MTFWNIVTGDLAEARGLSLVDTARLFALVNVSIHDGLQTSFTSKFVYGLWRPVTAIQRADEDLNDADHRGPHLAAAAGDAAVSQLRGERGLSLEGRFVRRSRWRSARTTSRSRSPGRARPAITREFTSLSQLADTVAKSRIWGGIHYQFDTDASQVACAKVAEYAFANFMRPRSMI